MNKIDWMIMENNRILDEQQHRMEVENEAFALIAQGKFEEARELVETLDDSLLEFREWPVEEEKADDEVVKELDKTIVCVCREIREAEYIPVEYTHLLEALSSLVETRAKLTAKEQTNNAVEEISHRIAKLMKERIRAIDGSYLYIQSRKDRKEN